MEYSLFVHSHKFRKKGNQFYSTGGLSNDVLCRYFKQNQKLIVLARVVEVDQVNTKLSLISDPRITIINYEKLTKDEIKKYVRESNNVILRLPCFICNKVYKYVKQYNKNSLTEVVGCAFDSYWNYNILGKLISPYMFLKTRHIVKESKNVLYVTNEFLQRRYPNMNNNMGCSDVELPYTSEEVLNERLSRKKDEEKIVIGTIGAINVTYKGQEYVIRALNKLKKEGYSNIEYQLIGAGSSERLEKIARKNNIEDKIKFMGTMPHDKVFEWLDKIDIYIQPSNVEGLCRSLIEAMSRGCACLASSAGGNPELLYKKYIFKTKDVNDLEDKLLYIINSNKRKEETENFKKAKEYEKTKLEEKRNSFFKKIGLY